MNSLQKMTGLALLFMVALAVVTLTAGSYVSPGDTTQITWATAAPAAGSPAIKGNASSTGCIVGLALDGADTTAGSRVVLTKGIVNVPVAATPSAIEIGDYVYASFTASHTGTTSLTTTTTGYPYGKALEDYAATTTEKLIDVLLINQ